MASGFGGRYQGSVVDDADPIGEHRLRVIVPEIGTEVWIEFESGDPNSPIWVGVA